MSKEISLFAVTKVNAVILYFEEQEVNTQNLNNMFFPVFLHPTLWLDETSCTNNVKLHKPQPNHSNPVSDSLAVLAFEMLMVLSSSS